MFFHDSLMQIEPRPPVHQVGSGPLSYVKISLSFPSHKQFTTDGWLEPAVLEIGWNLLINQRDN